MKRDHQLAVECGKREIALTYDSAIAKTTMEIQIEEAPNSTRFLSHLDHFILKLPYLV